MARQPPAGHGQVWEGQKMRCGSLKPGRCWSAPMALCAAVLWATASAHAGPGAATENETLVSSRPDIFDPEYNQKRAKFTWVDAVGRLWVANVDRTTGMFKPNNGMGVLVDANALAAGEQVMIGNGPEWLFGPGPDRIVYTKFVPGLPRERENARLAVAEQSLNGTWTHRLLSELPRLRPYTNVDAGEPVGLISYVDPDGNQYWRDIAAADSEAAVPVMPPSRTLPMRFVSGQRATIFVAPVNGQSQVVRYWLDTQMVEQLTFDGGHGKTTPFMWQAPEFDNDFVFMIVASDGTELRIYRQLDKANPAWTVIYAVSAPPGTKLISPEPFVFGGKSYVFMSAMVLPDLASSSIYVANIDAAQPIFRKLTPDDPVRKRTDPEVFVTAAGEAFIYFARVDASTTAPCPCYEGIFRSNTGLPTAPAR